MNWGEMILAFAVVGIAVWLAFLALFFLIFRLWIQALLADVPVSILDIARMRLRGCPPQLVIHALIALAQRGVKATAREAEDCYLAGAVHGERITTADELANLLGETKRNAPDAPSA